MKTVFCYHLGKIRSYFIASSWVGHRFFTGMKVDKTLNPYDWHDGIFHKWWQLTKANTRKLHLLYYTLAGSSLGLILATAEIPHFIITERKREGSLNMIRRKMDGEYANTTRYHIHPDYEIVNIRFTVFFCYLSLKIMNKCTSMTVKQQSKLIE